MNITQSAINGKTVLAPEGRLDTVSAPELEKVVKDVIPTTDELVLDLAKLDYISSAGLRILLSAQKAMMTKGGMTVCNVNETILEIFEVTGFSDILTIV
ncbi:MAG: STAS domain-containing protein [Clostridia bacterium]|nr:STAS domain-containing protein [Clostridia bacterium]